MAEDNKVLIELELKGMAAVGELQKVEESLKKVNKELKTNEGNTTKNRFEQKKLQEAKKNLNAGIRKNIQQFKAENTSIKGLGNSYNGLVEKNKILVQRYRKLDPTIEKNRAVMKKLSKQINTNTNSLKKMDSSMGRSFRNVGNYKTAITGLAGAFIGTAGVAGLATIIKGAIAKITEFQQSIANLSAITGATGSDLAFLRNEAIRLGSATSLSASQVSEGFKLIASAKPELLENTKALTQVTEATIMLAEAAGIDMAEAAKAVTNSLNQFGVGAEMAGKFVDVLAAGSKFGAGDINFLNVALIKAGVVAKGAGLSFQETAAALEVLAEKGVPAEAAGTNLRNILLRLQKEGKGFVDGKFNLQAALSQVSAEMAGIVDPAKKAGAMTKLFGTVNIAAGQALLTNTERLTDLTNKLDINGIAAEQQKTNTDTLKGSTDRLSSAYEGLILSIESGEGVIGKVLRGFVDLTAAILGGITPMNKHSDVLIKEQKELNNLVGMLSLTNKEEETRMTFISKLQKEYPNFIGNVKQEAITNEYLKDRLIDVNKAYLAKIKIQIKQEKLNEIAIAELEKEAQLEKRIYDLAQSILRLKKETNIDLSTENTLMEKGVKLRDELEKRFDKEESFRGKESIQYEEIRDLILAVNANTKDLNDTRKDAENILSEKNALETAYSTTLKKVDKTTQDVNATTVETTETLKSYKDELAEIAPLSLVAFAETLPEGFEAKLKALTEKTEKLRKEAEGIIEIIDDEGKVIGKTTVSELERDEEIQNQKQALAKQGQDALFSIASEGVTNRANEEIRVLQEKQKAGLISEEAFEAQSTAIKKAAFRKQKAMGVAEIMTNLALELSAMAKAAGGNPFNAVTAGGAGVAQYATLATLAVARAGLNTALVLSQKFAKGGLVEGGVFQGNSHADGGVKFASGGRVMEAEGGEAIINKRSTAMFKPMLSAMNAAGGGKKFALGGITPDAQLMSGALSESGIGAEMARQLNKIKVINVVSETTAQQNSITNVESEAIF